MAAEQTGPSRPHPLRSVGDKVQTFHNRAPWVGPLVCFSSVLYFAVQIFVGWIWTNPPYSLWTNTISDLGNTNCGTYMGSTVCSPRHGWMNVGFVFVGVVMAIGSLLMYPEFNDRRSWNPKRKGTLAGFAILSVAGLGAVFVGVFPENVDGRWHVVGASLAIGGGNIALLILAFALKAELPDRLRRFMFRWAPVSLVAALMFVFKRHFGLGSGGLERIAAYPETVWLISLGIWIAHDRVTGRRPARSTAAKREPLIQWASRGGSAHGE